MRILNCAAVTLLLIVAGGTGTPLLAVENPWPAGGPHVSVGDVPAAVAVVEDAAAARQGRIDGTVVEEDTGRPLAAAQVEVVGTGLGSLTGPGGAFSIANVPAGEREIRVRRLGYAPTTATVTVVADETVTLRIVMTAQALALDEVVVTGTPGGAERRSLGNVVDRMQVEDIRQVSPARDVQELLYGRVPGLVVDPGGGQVGASGGPIRIRGSSSMALDNDPIIYIDGIRMNSDPFSGNPQGSRDGRPSRLNDINPDDIAHIEVIKGPAAATLFGTEASNGVIQILTKRGQQQDAQFDARVSLGGSWHHDLAGRLFDQCATVSGEIICFQGGNILTQEALTGTWPGYRTGLSQDYSLSVRGGTDRIRYFASGRQARADGTVEWNWTRNTQGRANLGVRAHETLDIDVNAAYSSGQTRQTGEFFRIIFWATPATNEFAGGSPSRLRGFANFTPEAMRDDHVVMTGTDRTNLSATVRFNPRPWLSSTTTGGVDLTETSNETLWFADPLGSAGIFGAFSQGRKVVTRIKNEVLSFDHSTTARYRLTDQLGGATSAGAQVFDRTDWVTSAIGDDFPARNVTTVGAAAVTQGGETFVQNVTVGGFVQQQLDWGNRLFLTGAVRVDDNSAFGERSSAAVFPKVSGAWVLHEEEFFRVPHVSQLRLRFAWGQAGMQPNAFDAARLFSVQTGPGNVPIFTPSSFGNPDLEPEVGSEWEVGFDAGLLRDRISVELTQFFKTTKDAIVEQGLAPSGGFPGSQLVNLAEVDNWGTEIAVRGVVAQTPRFRWELGGSWSYQRNEIGDLGEDRDVIAVTGVVGPGDRQHREGFSLAGWFAQRVLSAEFVDGVSGAVTNIMCDGGTGRGGVEMGGPPVPCAEAPNVFWGHSEPTWLVSLHSSFDVGAFRLFTIADGRGGHIVMDNGINAASTSFQNTRKSNEQTDPIFQAYRQIGRSPIGFHSGSFVKLREVSLRYNIPDRLIAGFGVHSASLNVGARNLLTIWQRDKEHFFSGERVIDPEIMRPGQRFQGEQQATPPPLKSFDVTLRVSF